ncbi:hypothetical protein HAX54_042479 [Datura stramonium]|uniref:Uncharacterized protein n=1 Tax=Datura stramonium TaxID=4076 RepID=A0ABS8W0V7_DATST|nr:hypothetical protein [Datura stramonium]
MWYKDKFEVCGGPQEHKLQGFVISTTQRLFRAWKARLHVLYSSYSTDEDRLSHRPMDIEGQLQQLVVEQQSEEVKHPMNRDEILSSVLEMHDDIRLEMQADMDRKLEEECEQLAANLKRNMEEYLSKN